MAVMVLLEVQANKGTGDELVATFKAILPDTRAFDGFLDIVVPQKQDDKDNLAVVEQWETRQQYEKYLAWRTERGDVKILESMWESPTWRFFDFWGV